MDFSNKLCVELFSSVRRVGFKNQQMQFFQKKTLVFSEKWIKRLTSVENHFFVKLGVELFFFSVRGEER